MYKCIIISIFFFAFILSIGCKKQHTDNIPEPNITPVNIKKNEETITRNLDDIEPHPLGMYHGINDTSSPCKMYGSKDIFSPNGKVLRVYNNEIKETLWGPIYSPIIYLYSRNNEELAKYDTHDLIAEDFWPGNVDVTYNNKRNSFDLSFQLEAGNYGTGYIDLNTNEYFRESTYRAPSEEDILEMQSQNQDPEYHEEGATLRKIDPTIFSRSP